MNHTSLHQIMKLQIMFNQNLPMTTALFPSPSIAHELFGSWHLPSKPRLYAVIIVKYVETINKLPKKKTAVKYTRSRRLRWRSSTISHAKHRSLEVSGDPYDTLKYLRRCRQISMGAILRSATLILLCEMIMIAARSVLSWVRTEKKIMLSTRISGYSSACSGVICRPGWFIWLR